MRVVVGTDVTRDPKDAEVDRHVQMMSRFAARALDGGEGANTLSITMIVRSAASVPVQALLRCKDDLFRAGISARAVLAKLDPEDDLRQLFACLVHLGPLRPAKDLLRWAHNPRLLDAHEQVTLGATMCWSGDAMRRDADKRNAMTLFDDAAPETARLDRLAFEALWTASTFVPERRLSGPVCAKPSGAFQPDAAAPLAASLRPSLEGWPLVRH